MMNATTNTNGKEFYATRQIFREYINYTHPYSYEEWLKIPQESKAAALYVQYFNEIILAWFKTKSFYASEQEGVETICQYLLKNVPVIEENPKRFSKKYIYRVAYNCLYCISHDRKIDRLRWELEMSNILLSGEGEEIDLFDALMGEDDEFYSPHVEAKFRMWSMISDMGDDYMQVCGQLLDGGRLPKGVSYKRKAEIIQNLQDALEEFKKVFYI